MMSNEIGVFGEDLNEAQYAAATFEGKHLLVLAGAGSGKTRTIIARARYLLQKGITEDRIRILSFTNKSADEIVARILREVGGMSQGALRGQTFHSWCYEIIRNHPEFFAQSAWTLLPPEEIASCIGFVRGVCIPEGAACPKNSEIATIYGRVLNTRCSLTRAMHFVLDGRDTEGDETMNRDPGFVERKANVSTVIQAFIDYKAEHQLIDYDDMLDIVAQTMDADADARRVISGEVDHILVDEMQDTNRLQYDVLLKFVEGSHLFCVGDDAQSIYAFRGADFESIHGFTSLVSDAKVIRLETNYRSTQAVLDVSNWLLEQSPLHYDKHLHAVRNGTRRPMVINWTTPDDQARDIVQKIQKAVADGGNYADHLVLARKNYELNDVCRYCTAQKIPYQIFGGIVLLECAHILDVLTTFRIVANYRDELAWIRYLKSFRGIGDALASRIVLTILSGSDLDTGLAAARRQNIIPSQAVTAIEAVKTYETQPGAAVGEALRCMEPALIEKYAQSWVYRKKDFDALAELASQSPDIAAFVGEYLMNKAIFDIKLGPLETTTDVVTLSTIHSAKGLEAKSVYVVNVTNGNWPDARNCLEEADREEERRCLYVALTRAKDELYIYRKLRSGVRASAKKNLLAKGDDYFLADLPSALVEEMTILKQGIIVGRQGQKPIANRSALKPRFNFD